MLPQPPRGATTDDMDKFELARWFTSIWKNMNLKGATGTYMSQDGKLITVVNGFTVSIT